MSTITVVGAGIGRQFINGDPNWYEWRVSYEIDGRGPVLPHGKQPRRA
jgi:hypothetical protein